MTVMTIDPKAVANWLATGEADLVDVREALEYNAEHIAGSRHVPLADVQAGKLVPLPGKKLVLQCQAGGRSAKGCAAVAHWAAGQQVYSLEGGIGAWKAAGLPVVRVAARLLPVMQQMQLTVGVINLAFALLALFVSPQFLWGNVVIGAGLMNAGLTGWCGVAKLLSAMPWNRAVATGSHG